MHITLRFCMYDLGFLVVDVTILPLFKNFVLKIHLPVSSNKYGYSRFHLFFYFLHCFLKIMISPNNLNHQKFIFSKLSNLMIHNVRWSFNHQFFLYLLSLNPLTYEIFIDIYINTASIFFKSTSVSSLNITYLIDIAQNFTLYSA